jgi:hypothetical protein
VSHECRNFVVDIYLKTNVEPKYKRKFTENFLKRVEMDHVKLNEIMKNKNYDADFYMDMRLNWVKLIRTFINRFDFEHIELEDLSRYNEKDNINCAVTLENENGDQ